ncbi:uncharacterized protein LOC109814835 [Cajanus cajan]|uniref:uncharacterized protein LOC109814835 n=1 Tax=Cajanus cajan TaxID=3821 RepID=UPI00098DD5E3|nr:uncharacterized protein LOC109814835 [Cajanus cajan]
MRVLWNGEMLEEFKPERGIRQGDPISPYLFVLCIERLFHLIQVVVETKLWKPTQIARRAPKLSHLAFADNLLLFAEASEEQVDVIIQVLELFCKSSGQKGFLRILEMGIWFHFGMITGSQAMYRNRVTFQGSSSHPHELVSRILAQVNILQDSIPLFRCQTIATTNKRINSYCLEQGIYKIGGGIRFPASYWSSPERVLFAPPMF